MDTACTNDSNDGRRTSRYHWYSHPLTSLIVIAALATLLTIPFDTTTASLTMAGMLTFLTACKDSYRRDDRST